MSDEKVVKKFKISIHTERVMDIYEIFDGDDIPEDLCEDDVYNLIFQYGIEEFLDPFGAIEIEEVVE